MKEDFYHGVGKMVVEILMSFGAGSMLNRLFFLFSYNFLFCNKHGIQHATGADGQKNKRTEKRKNSQTPHY